MLLPSESMDQQAYPDWQCCFVFVTATTKKRRKIYCAVKLLKGTLQMVLDTVSLIFEIWRKQSNFPEGRATAQAVSRRLSTVAGWVRAQARSCWICGGQSATGAGFLRVLWFRLSILIPPSAPHSSSIVRGWYNRSVVADVPSGLSLTPPQETKRKLSRSFLSKRIFVYIHHFFLRRFILEKQGWMDGPLVCPFRNNCIAIWGPIFVSLGGYLHLTSLVSWTHTSVGHVLFLWLSEHVFFLPCLL
jgi:hypothetical protein